MTPSWPGAAPAALMVITSHPSHVRSQLDSNLPDSESDLRYGRMIATASVTEYLVRPVASLARAQWPHPDGAAAAAPQPDSEAASAADPCPSESGCSRSCGRSLIRLLGGESVAAGSESRFGWFFAGGWLAGLTPGGSSFKLKMPIAGMHHRIRAPIRLMLGDFFLYLNLKL